MVTLVDNLHLSEEERIWYEKIVSLPPLKIEISQWIDLEELIKGINENLDEDEIHVLVATGGVEVYPQNNNPNVFVFESPNFGRANQPTFKLDFEDYRKITENPIKHHKTEIQRLCEYLSKFDGQNVKVIEGDIGNSGLSAARLCAIFKSIYEHNPTTILIGAAPDSNIFSVIRRSTLILLSGDGFYRDDLRGILGLDEVPHKIIARCKDGYIRRASEILGVSRLENVDEDVRKWEKFYESKGILSSLELKEYANWFRAFTLRKIDRVRYVRKRINNLKVLAE